MDQEQKSNKEVNNSLSTHLYSSRQLLFSVNILERNKSLLTDQIDLLKRSIRDVKNQQPVQIHAMVVLPDHRHALWTLLEKDSDFSLR